MTARAASFDRRDVVRGLCEALPPGAPASVELIDALTERFVASDAVVTLIGRGRLGDRKDERRGRDERRWSTPEMLAVERALLDAALARQSAAAGVVPQELVGAALAARPTLVADQAAMVERLTTSGAGVDVVVGKAGSGKTFALAAAAEAWHTAGYRVCGVALAARAAAELEAASGIPSGTLARFLADVEAPRGQLDQRSVVVLDEAVMVAARHRDVADLNARARQRRMDAGQLGGPEVVADERAFAAGEQVVCLRNDRRLGVVNGTLATVVEVRSDDRSLVVETNDGARRELPAWYLEGGHLDHAYALTIHKAQGMTVDRSFVLGSDSGLAVRRPMSWMLFTCAPPVRGLRFLAEARHGGKGGCQGVACRSPRRGRGSTRTERSEGGHGPRHLPGAGR